MYNGGDGSDVGGSDDGEVDDGGDDCGVYSNSSDNVRNQNVFIN